MRVHEIGGDISGRFACLNTFVFVRVRVHVSYQRFESLNLCGGFLCFLICALVIGFADGFGLRA